MFNPELTDYVQSIILQELTTNEKDYLTEVFRRFKGYPSLEQMWTLLDEPWIEYGCDPEHMDERTTAFYRHPVWMLNGLFIEQHIQSLENRQIFTNWVVQQQPARLADFGGGFGGLARFIGDALPNAQVEVVDPHPHLAAIALAATTPNVRFVPELSGEYDVLIATDVFEHVLDPIGLAAQTAKHLREGGGQYLIANCFSPIILCHLPQLFYFQIAWDCSMQAMGLQPGERVSYGRSYQCFAELNIPAARKTAERARKLWPLFQKLPRGRARIGSSFVRLLCM